MTEIDKKVLELASEALARAIEQHEAFRQEVSDALRKRGFAENSSGLGRFIIPKPDPLAKLFESIAITLDADDFRAALDEAGLEIREKKDG